MVDDDIETEIRRYFEETVGRNEVPSRDPAIRFVTGELAVLPSDVARVLRTMAETGKLKVGSGDRIYLLA